MANSTVLVTTASPRLEGAAERIAWKGVSMGSGLLAGLIVQRVLAAFRKKVTSTGDAPLNPADPRIGWVQAITWSVAAAVGVAVARVIGDRLAVKGWELATGGLPPGFDA